MNINRRGKHRLTNKPRFTVQYDPDLDHEAWQGSVKPTPQREPDAFYKTYLQTSPVAVKQMRKKPHTTLSIRQLRKRLHAAGLRGDRLNQVANEIKNGPQTIEDRVGGGLNFMGWPESILRQKYGRRITRAVTRFVHGKLIMVDELYHLVNSDSGFTEFLQNAMSFGRKFNSLQTEVTQSNDQLSAAI